MRSVTRSSSVISSAAAALFLFGLMGGLAASPLTAQQTETAAHFLPSTTLAYVEIRHADNIIDTVLNHPLRKKIESIPDIKKALNKANPAMIQMVVGMFETQMKEPWNETLANICHGGIHVAFDSKSNGVLVMVNAQDEAKLKRVAGIVLGWVRSESEKNGKPAPFKISEYREGKVAKFEGAVVARVGHWLLVSNKPELARQVADNILDGTNDSLANNQEFASAIQSRRPDGQVWSYLDLNAIRKSGVAKDLFTGKTQDAAAELLFGGLMSTLKNTPYVIASLQIETSGIDVTASIPHDPAVVESPREFYFGENSSGRAPLGLQPENLIANVTSYRDIGLWWLSKEALFDEKVIADLAQADSNLSTFFGGLDFGQEVLGSVQPKMQIVVTRQDLGSDMEIKIPAFAIIGKLKDHQKTQRRFKVAYQSLIGLVNVGLGQKKMPQLDLESTRTDDIVITSATYLPDDLDESNSMIYNFSPTLAFHQDTIIISSTRALAVELAELDRIDQGDAWKDSGSNTALSADATLIKQSLDDNREMLITQNMLDKGASREAAASEIDLILSVLDFVKDVEAHLNVTPQQVELEIQLNFPTSPQSASQAR